MTTQAAPNPAAEKNLYVVQTFCVPRPSDLKDITHYEVHLAAVSPPTPNTKILVMLTNDVEFYQRALALEGSGLRVSIRYHAGRRNGERCRVLDALEIQKPTEAPGR